MNEDEVTYALSKQHEPMSLGQMKELIHYRKGWKSLRNYLEAVELAKGITIIQRRPAKERIMHLVTLVAIREQAPEILRPELRRAFSVTFEGSPANRQVFQAAREYLTQSEDRMAEVARNVVAKRVGPQLEKLGRRIQKVETAQDQAKKQLKQLELQLS